MKGNDYIIVNVRTGKQYRGFKASNVAEFADIDGVCQQIRSEMQVSFDPSDPIKEDECPFTRSN